MENEYPEGLDDRYKTVEHLGTRLMLLTKTMSLEEREEFLSLFAFIVCCEVEDGGVVDRKHLETWMQLGLKDLDNTD